MEEEECGRHIFSSALRLAQLKNQNQRDRYSRPEKSYSIISSYSKSSISKLEDSINSNEGSVIGKRPSKWLASLKAEEKLRNEEKGRL